MIGVRSPSLFVLSMLLLSSCGPDQFTPEYQPLEVATVQLQDGVVGSAYRQELEATGGDGTYSWTLRSGALPDGLALSTDGVISGVPATYGSWSFMVGARSGDLQEDSALYAVYVEAPVLIAFIGDQGWESPDSANGPRAVLRLIRDEGADLVLHSGDLEYLDSPALWNQQVDDVLGPTFPYLASVGNHDTPAWGGALGYRARLEARAAALGQMWTGVMGEASSLNFRGIRLLLGAPGLDPAFDSTYFSEELSSSAETWRICSWHLNQTLMQVGGKANEAGWEPYEACRGGGAIIATAHEHSYSRTHLLSDVSDQVVASTSDTVEVSRGRTFVFVSGLGGHSVRVQLLDGPWWASVYTLSQGATYGVLFGSFNYGGIPGLARFYFKNIRGEIIDEFWVRSSPGPGRGLTNGLSGRAARPRGVSRSLPPR